MCVRERELYIGSSLCSFTSDTGAHGSFRGAAEVITGGTMDDGLALQDQLQFQFQFQFNIMRDV